MLEDKIAPAEKIHSLQFENQHLRDDVDRLNLEVKKLSRELRTTKNLLDKVAKAAEAKDSLGVALSMMNAKQRAYTDMLLESCPNIIILFDSNGRIVLSTAAFLTATGIPNFDYIKNLNYKEIFSIYLSDENMKAFIAAVNKVLSSKTIVTLGIHADFSHSGHPKLFSVEMRCTGADEKTTGILVVLVDVTDIVYEKQRAEAANKAKSNFLAAMSHEIRTPMNAIIGLGELLVHSGLNSKEKKYAVNICRTSNTLLQIINEILDFSKIEAGKMKLANDTFNLKESLDNLHSMFLMLCKEKQLSLDYHLAENLPEVVHGDETRLRQILTNLLSNAVKYTRKGGVVFSAWMAESRILRFDVKDSGIGIREEDMGKLFEPFEQLDLMENRSVGGTGLGLAISYNLCKIMGGSLTVNSVYGEGSNFSVYLPYVPPTKEQSTNKEDSEIFDFKAPDARILVVDDIEINLEVVEAMLSVFEIVPDLAFSGPQAIEFANEKQYDMIFMDHIMPGMNGIVTTKNIRKLGGWNKTVPIVALTANAVDGMDRVFLSSQMDDCLFKPLNISNLNRCLKKWLPPNLLLTEE